MLHAPRPLVSVFRARLNVLHPALVQLRVLVALLALLVPLKPPWPNRKLVLWRLLLLLLLPLLRGGSLSPPVDRKSVRLPRLRVRGVRSFPAPLPLLLFLTPVALHRGGPVLLKELPLPRQDLKVHTLLPPLLVRLLGRVVLRLLPNLRPEVPPVRELDHPRIRVFRLPPVRDKGRPPRLLPPDAPVQLLTPLLLPRPVLALLLGPVLHQKAQKRPPPRVPPVPQKTHYLRDGLVGPRRPLLFPLPSWVAVRVLPVVRLLRAWPRPCLPKRNLRLLIPAPQVPTWGSAASSTYYGSA